MTLNAYLNRFRSVKHSNSAMSWNAWDISTALFPCILTKQHGVRGEIYLLKTPWKHRIRGSKFHNIPRCLGCQELVPLVRVQKPLTIHYQPVTTRLFDSPGSRLPNITVIQGTYTEKCVMLNSNTIPSQLAGVTRRSVMSVHSWCSEADS